MYPELTKASFLTRGHHSKVKWSIPKTGRKSLNNLRDNAKCSNQNNSVNPKSQDQRSLVSVSVLQEDECR